jgi:VanZ family protein
MRSWYTKPTSMKYFIWVLAEILIIFIIMSLPGNKLPAENSFTHAFKVDKLVHILLFFILSYTLLLYFKKSNKKYLKNKRVQIIAIILCIVYGIFLEFFQKIFVPSRSFDVADILADSIGAIFGLFFYYFYSIKNINK